MTHARLVVPTRIAGIGSPEIGSVVCHPLWKFPSVNRAAGRTAISNALTFGVPFKVWF